jgi:splicing factor 3B subunit 3
MRTEYTTLCGRDHTAYRSFYYPVKSIIDGDLCEKFSNLDMAKQKSIAEELDRTPNEVSKVLLNLFLLLNFFLNLVFI